MDPVHLYSTAEPFGEFSNFARHPITLGGERWPTSEHYFQAQKFADAGYRQLIRAAKTPMIAARLGRDRSQKLRRDWESVKVAVMREAVRAKFAQHPELAALLLSTGEATLVERTANDDYWGDGGDGSGQNWLGRILTDGGACRVARRSGRGGAGVIVGVGRRGGGVFRPAARLGLVVVGQLARLVNDARPDEELAGFLRRPSLRASGEGYEFTFHPRPSAFRTGRLRGRARRRGCSWGFGRRFGCGFRH